jgi:hypothetical protein
MVYTPFGTHMALAIVNILVKMHLTHHVHVKTLAMVRALVKTLLNLGMIYAHGFKTHLVDQYIINNSFKRQTKINYAFQIMKIPLNYNPMSFI